MRGVPRMHSSEILRISQFVTSSDVKFSKNVYAFTQEGIAMLSDVLQSACAVQVNIAIMRAFVRLREALTSNKIWREGWPNWCTRYQFMSQKWG